MGFSHEESAIEVVGEAVRQEVERQNHENPLDPTYNCNRIAEVAIHSYRGYLRSRVTRHLHGIKGPSDPQTRLDGLPPYRGG